MADFEHIGMDPVVAAEMMELMGATPDDLRNYGTVAKIQDIVNYFGSYENRGFLVKKLIANRKAGSKFEALHTYVQLQREKIEALNSLDLGDFAPDMQEEIRSGYITLGKKADVRRTMEERKNSLAATVEGMSLEDIRAETEKLMGIEATLNHVDEIDHALLSMEG